jgi:hypothetical protein
LISCTLRGTPAILFFDGRSVILVWVDGPTGVQMSDFGQRGNCLLELVDSNPASFLHEVEFVGIPAQNDRARSIAFDME